MATERGFRKQLADLLENEDRDKALTVLRSLLDAQKTVRAHCQCGRKFDVPCHDGRTALEALKFWSEQGFGRIGTTEPDQTVDIPATETERAKLLTDPAARAAMRRRLAARAQRARPGARQQEAPELPPAA